LADFLPVYDQFIDLKEKYSNDEFGAKFAGLSIADTFSKMGVTEYSVEAGQAVDNFRVAVVENEYSTEFAKDTVIHPIAPGMELEGNVIRAAQCVASAGSEEEAAAEADVSEQQE
jgi:molecular chaperone GrpE (heat shock protein)